MAAYNLVPHAWTAITDTGLLQVRGGMAQIALTATPATNAWWLVRNGDTITTTATVYGRAGDVPCVVYVDAP